MILTRFACIQAQDSELLKLWVELMQDFVVDCDFVCP